MKKLLITTMAAASLAFCAKAADTGALSGINFESFTEGAKISFTTEESDGSVYWSTESEDGLFVISNLTSFADTDYAPSRPAHWADDASNLRALFIDSDKPLVRNVNPKVSVEGTATFNAYQLQENSVDRNLFFDSVVQFTATDTAPTVDYDAGDKLIAWLYYSEDASESNPGIFGETAPLKRLVITAGYYDAGGSKSIVNYLTSLEIEPDSWHRLTIKAINNIGNYIPGFEVYVDGEKIGGVIDYSATDAAVITTFPSMVDKNNGGVNTVTGVAFDGKGAVDDLVFTTTDPFAEASYAVTVTLTDDSWSSYGVAKYYSVDGGTTYAELADGDSAELYYNSGMTISIAQTAENILFKVPVPDGYKLEGGVATTETPDEGLNYYWTKQLAVADIIDAEGVGSVALVYVADDGTEEETYKLAISAENATIDGLTAGSYAEGTNFVFTVTPADGYQVTSVMMNTTALELNAEGKYAFQMPDGDVKVTVTVEAKSYEITVNADANVTVTVEGGTTQKYGDTVKYSLVFANGYTLGSVSIVGETSGYPVESTVGDGADTFTMPAENVTITVTSVASGEDPGAEELPTIGGTEYDAESSADFIAAAKSNAEIKVPTGWTLDGNTLKDASGNKYATFGEYYDVTLADGTVTLTVNAKAAPSFGETAAGKGDAITVTDTQFTVCINNAIEGFYYQLKAYSDAACTKVIEGYAGDAGNEAKGTNLGVTMTKPEGYDAVFFKVFVDDKPFATTEAQ